MQVFVSGKASNAMRIGAALAFLALPTLGYAQDTSLPYSDKGGLVVTITKKSGIGTAKAVVSVEHTRQNALDYCEGFEMTSSKSCIDRTMANVKVERQISGNCKTGRFKDLWGESFQFKGRAKGDDTEYTIIELATRQPLDGSSASLYTTRLAAFEALCPNRLR